MHYLHDQAIKDSNKLYQSTKTKVKLLPQLINIARIRSFICHTPYIGCMLSKCQYETRKCDCISSSTMPLTYVKGSFLSRTELLQLFKNSPSVNVTSKKS